MAGDYVYVCQRVNRRDTARVVILAVRSRVARKGFVPGEPHGPYDRTRLGGELFSLPYAYLPTFDRAGTIHSAAAVVGRIGDHSLGKT